MRVFTLENLQFTNKLYWYSLNKYIFRFLGGTFPSAPSGRSSEEKGVEQTLFVAFGDWRASLLAMTEPLNATGKGNFCERKSPKKKNHSPTHFGLLLVISAAIKARPRTAEITADEAESPPPRTPRKPFSSTAVFTPLAIT